VLGVARRDLHLGAGAALALAHPLRDVGGERLRVECLGEHHLVDRLLHDLLEARHVRALLVPAEVHEAIELRVEELLALGAADANHLLHAGHSDAGEADRRRWTAGLHVAVGAAERRGLDSHGATEDDSGGGFTRREPPTGGASSERSGYRSLSEGERGNQVGSRSRPTFGKEGEG
jgi:hypothetical protein